MQERGIGRIREDFMMHANKELVQKVIQEFSNKRSTTVDMDEKGKEELIKVSNQFYEDANHYLIIKRMIHDSEEIDVNLLENIIEYINTVERGITRW